MHAPKNVRIWYYDIGVSRFQKLVGHTKSIS